MRRKAAGPLRAWGRPLRGGMALPGRERFGGASERGKTYGISEGFHLRHIHPLLADGQLCGQADGDTFLQRLVAGEVGDREVAQRSLRSEASRAPVTAARRIVSAGRSFVSIANPPFPPFPGLPGTLGVVSCRVLWMACDRGKDVCDADISGAVAGPGGLGGKAKELSERCRTAPTRAAYALHFGDSAARAAWIGAIRPSSVLWLRNHGIGRCFFDLGLRG